MNLINKNIVITGGTSGIGLEIVKELIKDNNKIIVIGRNFSKVPNLMNIYKYQCDISLKHNIDKMIEYIFSIFNKVDVFFANAGYAYYEEINAPNWEHIQSIYATNVFSPIYTLEKLLERQTNQKIHYVVTASAVSYMHLPGFALYSSTKAAINAFIESFKYQRMQNLKVSIVYPIATKTNFFSRAGKNIPKPFPVDNPKRVACSIIKELEIDSFKIFPNKLYLIFSIINRIFPFFEEIYKQIENYRFHKWLKNKAQQK